MKGRLIPASCFEAIHSSTKRKAVGLRPDGVCGGWADDNGIVLVTRHGWRTLDWASAASLVSVERLAAALEWKPVDPPRPLETLAALAPPEIKRKRR